jgi:3-dehydroquinate synthase
MGTNSFMIKSKQEDYPVFFFSDINEAILNVTASDLFILIDRNIHDIYKVQLNDFLSKNPYFIAEPTEQFKSLSGVEKVAEWLVENKATKSSHIIAIGGGITQDVATFVSSIYHRGIRWTFFPTTLLSQADSCIGAKCGINLNEVKNQLGVIYAPSQVFIVEEFLGTLSEEEFKSGFGEIYKLSVTGEREFYEELKSHLSRNGLKNVNMKQLIKLSLLAKQEIIELDEYENDLRRVLNYGHTFGHALEAISKNKIPHGVAILFGMDLINFLGFKWGITSQDFFLDFRKTIQNHYRELNYKIVIDASKLIDKIKSDKKMFAGSMNFAVPIKSGEIIIHKYVIDDKLKILVQEYLDHETIFNFT